MLCNFDSTLFDNPDKEVTTSEIYIDKKHKIFHPKGLFSEQIFGPVKNYECQCGELKGEENKGRRCPNCGVLCDSNILRYQEFGYIKLNIPVLYPLIANKLIKKLFASKRDYDLITSLYVYADSILFFNKKTYKIENNQLLNKLLDINAAEFVGTIKDLKEYINTVLDNIKVTLSISGVDEVDYDGIKITAGTVKELEELKQTYLLDYPIFGIYSLYRLIQSDYFQSEVLPKLFEKSPELEPFKKVIFLDKLPVCPPEIRPYVQTPTKTIKHEITRTLESIININNQGIAKFFNDNNDNNDNNNNQQTTSLYSNISEDEKVSDIIFKDTFALRLQKQITNYYDQIINQISGKEGKIRQYIHGKTIDFSSRGVITPSIKIKPYEVEIPYYTAKEVFSPYFTSFLIKEASKNPEHKNIAIKYLSLQHNLITENDITPEENKIIDQYFDKFIDKVNLKEIRFYTVVNRAPTLWIYNFLVFDVVIKKDKSDYTIGVHPLFVEQQNADFDGDCANTLINLYVNIRNSSYTIKNKEFRNIHISELENLEIEIE